MKTKISGLFILIILPVWLLMSQYSKAQLNKGYGISDHWYFNINSGFTWFFGDVSSYDSEVLKKLKYESATAIGAIFGKELNPVLGLRGQLISGSLIGYKSASAFKNTFLQNTIQLTINANKLFFGNYKNFKWNLYGYGGLGMIYYRSLERNIYTSEILGMQGYSGRNLTTKPVSAMVYTLGGGLKIFLSQNFELNIEGCICPVGSDLLDTEFGKTKMGDIFTYISGGLTFNMGSLSKNGCCKKVTYKGYANSRRTWQKRRSSFAYKKKNLHTSMAYKRH